MSTRHLGNTQPSISQEEHDATLNPATKRVLPYGYDGTQKNVLYVDDQGISRSIVTIASTIVTTQGLVTLAASPNFIGLTTTVISSAPTLYAVVNTTAAGQSSVVLDTGANWIGLVSTASIHAKAELVASTAAIGKLSSNSGIDIGDVDITSIAAGDNNIGNVDAIQSGNWNIQSLLSVASIYGEVKVTNTVPVTLGNVTLNTSPNYIGLVTITNSSSVTIVPSNGDYVSTYNSTASVLGISGTFIGTGDDCLGYSSISTMITSDKNSTANGMKFQFSTDNTNWDDDVAGGFDFIANTTRRFQFPVTGRYYRVNYTNTNSAQTFFRVQTILHRYDILTTIHRMDSDVKVDRSAQLVKAGLIAQVNGTGDFTPIQANAAGVLKIGGSVGLDTGTNFIGQATVRVASGTAQIGSVTVSNPITLGSIVTIVNAPYSYYNQSSLISGYVYHGFTTPGNAANTATFRLMRESLNFGDVLFASGVATYIHTWSAASTASITYL